MNPNPPEKPDEMATISIQNTDQMWDLLSGKLEEFYQAWESKTPPDIEKFIPESPQALRRFALIELIKVDIEQRLEYDLPEKSIATFAQTYPELYKNGKIEADLLFEEIELRKRFNRKIDLASYEKFFPAQMDTIHRFIGDPSNETRTKLLSKKTIAQIQPGTSIDDFELIMELGRGAFATVFLARQISMQRLVALKVSKDQGDEPKTLAQLDCKNIVRVYDVRDIDNPQCRLLYMKFVAGGALHDIVQQIKTIPIEERNGAILLSVIDGKAEKTGQDIPLDSRTRQRILSMEWFEIVFWLGAEIAQGLAYAHQQDVLHRDLKPANVLLTTEGIPQIVDFNVSFCSNVEGSSAESFFGGSLAYMSPEQLEAFDPIHPREPESLGPASDIYSLGIILWELMFGQRPFPDQVNDGDYSKLIVQLIQQRSEFQIEPALPPDAGKLSVDLAPLFHSILEPDPEKRINNAKELAGELSLMADRPSRELLRPKTTWVSRLLQKQLILFVVLTVVIPSGLAAVFNYFYNFVSIIQPKGKTVADTFEGVQTVINLCAFPIGIAFLIALSVRLFSKINQVRHDKTADSVTVRNHIIRMPLISITVPLSIWTVCGLAYPIAMNIGQAPITLGDSLHFLTSLVLCGLIASVYPFFIIAYVAIKFWYPAAFQTSQLTAQDPIRIENITNRVWFFMMLGVMLPMFSVLLMVATQKANDRILLAVLAGFSFIGLGVIFLIFKKLQRHLDTVRMAIAKLSERSVNE